MELLVRCFTSFSMSVLVMVLLLGVLWPGSQAKKHQSPMITSEDSPRRAMKGAECQFGKQVRELGSTWFADLGPPFGVMYCIKCECVGIQKKRRVVAKVHCRNIKNDCPKPSCDEPVLSPGRCCKVCPGDVHSPDLVHDVSPVMSVEEEEKNHKYFAALLTSRTGHLSEEGVLVTGSKDYTATGRFTFHRRNLYYSFYSTSRPRGIQFLDLRGNILEEQALSPYSPYQNATGKVCGVWRRIPREYRRLIREEKLVVSLLWERADLAISGQLYRYRTLATEMYSALLEGGLPGSGGTAVVTVSSTGPSIHVAVIFNGLFSPTDSTDVPLTLKLHTNDKQQTPVINEVIRVEKPSNELNVIEARSTVTVNELRLLSRHRLSVTVASKTSELSMSGRVVTRTTCELYQALLAHPNQPQAMVPHHDRQAAGLAWMYIDSEGALRYHIQIEKVNNEFVPSLMLERRLVELEDLSPSLKGDWANGTLERLNPKQLEQLYSGELVVNVATSSSQSVVRGRLTSRPASDPRNTLQGPSLLRPLNPNNYRLTGMVWAALDMECHLQYEVQISGPNVESKDYELYLNEVPMVAPGAPKSRRLLDSFSGWNHEGSFVAFLPIDLARIESGMVSMEITDLKTSVTLLRSDWTKIPVPSSCLPHYSDNDVPPIPGYSSDGGGGNSPEAPVLCYHGGRFHEEGAQWRAAKEKCQVCHCSAGRSHCEPLLCPPLPPSCQPVRLNDQCCHTCHNNSEETETGRGCVMAGQFFLPGSYWHPYLPPNGFDTCTVCTCNALTLTVSCPRMECPALNCKEGDAVRPDRKSCCKVCPHQLKMHVAAASGVVPLSPGQQGDQPSSGLSTTAEILAAGGCKRMGVPYANGEEWHPKVLGEVKCVKCHCKDGKVKCERKKCTKWSCNSECCVDKCPRNRRHTKVQSIFKSQLRSMPSSMVKESQERGH